MTLTYMDYGLWALALFLSGSIPFGMIITKLFSKQDIRTIGSGNIGATNVLRSGNKKAALLTLLLDLAKGLIPLLILSNFLEAYIANENCLCQATYPLVNGPHADPNMNTHLWTALYALPVLGHVFTPWLKFKGGKGIATGLGVLLAYSPLVALFGLLIWGATFWITRISSLSGLVAFAAAPFLQAFLKPLIQRIGFFS